MLRTPRPRLVLRGHARPWLPSALMLLAAVLTLVLTSGLILWAGANPFAAYHHYLISPLQTRFGVMELLVAATPLLFVGAAVAVAFRGGYYNIGAEGQLLCGAIGGTFVGIHVHGLPKPLAILLIVATGAAAGALWALIPALLRVRLGIDEVVTTLLLNPVALLLVTGLLNGPWRNPQTQFPESPKLDPSFLFPIVAPRSRVHLGLVLALVVLAVAWFVLGRTSTGIRLRAVGLSPHASKFAGIDVERMMLGAALVSGAIAGIAGVSELAGMQGRLTEGISPGYGYTGIVVATLGALSMVGVLCVSLLLGTIAVGAGTASRALEVPTQLGNIVTATLLLTTVAVLLLRRYRVVWRRSAGTSDGRA